MSLTSRPTPSNRSNPCPICEKVDGACRVLADDTIFCHGFEDARKGEKINGFICLKPSNGHTATFKPDNSAEWSEERKLEWEQRKRQREEQAQLHQEKLAKQSMPASERSKLYSEILFQLTLNEETLADLKARGFSDEDIAASSFKSIDKFQPLGKYYPVNLPGVGDKGTSFSNAYDGCICPVRNWEGEIVGAQGRVLGAVDGNKYRWFSSQKNPCHLYPEGELPLAVFKPESPSAIALCEGAGAKPFLASRRLNAIVLGAAGGQWASSPKQLQDYLNKAHEVLGGEKVIRIYPDAGDASNSSVTERWRKTCELLKDLGWRCEIGWWGQLTKQEDDIDELPVEKLTEINYISPEEFFNLCDIKLKHIESGKKEQQSAEEKEKRFQELKQARKTLTDFDPNENIVEVCEQHMEKLSTMVQPGVVTGVIARPGVGKTKTAINLSQSVDVLVGWSSRISLARELGSKLFDTKCLNDLSGDEKVRDCKKITFCSPSAPRIDPRILSNSKSLLLLDECDQVFQFNFSPLCNKDGARPLILSTLEAHHQATLEGGGIPLYMSADLTRKEWDYIKAISPKDTKFQLIKNSFNYPKPKIKVLNASSPEALVSKLLAVLKSGIPCFVLDDLKSGILGCQSITEYVRQEMPELTSQILEITADTQSDPRVVEFFSNVNKHSKKYQLITCSPSVISGISLENGHFKNGVFGFINGILLDTEIKQFLNRPRGAEDIYLWVAETGFLPSGLDKDDITPEKVKDYYKRNYERNYKHLQSFKPEYKSIEKSWSSPHFELYCKNMAYSVITSQFLKKFTLEHLEENGYTIEPFEFCPEGGVKQVSTKLSTIWDSIEISQAQAVESARFLSKNEMELVENGFREQIAINEELRLGYVKTKLRDDFGEEVIKATKIKQKSGEELSGYAAAFIKNKRRKYYRQMENFYLFKQDISEACEKDYSIEAKQMKMGERFPSDTRWDARRRFAREKIGLKAFLDTEKWLTPSDIKELCELLQQHPKLTKDTFGFNPENISNGQIFSSLFEQLGLRIDKKEVKIQKDGKKTKHYEYRVNKKDYEIAQLYCQHKLELKKRREEERVEKEASELQNVPALATKISNTHAKEEYERIKSMVSLELLKQALEKVGSQVRDRINDWYSYTKEAITQNDVFGCITEISIKEVDEEAIIAGAASIPTTAIATEEVSHQHSEAPTDSAVVSLEKVVSQQESEVTELVDREIQQRSPLCNLSLLSLEELWSRRLSRALLMTEEIARSLYSQLHQMSTDLLNHTWHSLTPQVQQKYCELFI